MGKRSLVSQYIEWIGESCTSNASCHRFQCRPQDARILVALGDRGENIFHDILYHNGGDVFWDSFHDPFGNMKRSWNDSVGDLQRYRAREKKCLSWNRDCTWKPEHSAADLQDSVAG
jgi:hypothetical protein